MAAAVSGGIRVSHDGRVEWRVSRSIRRGIPHQTNYVGVAPCISPRGAEHHNAAFGSAFTFRAFLFTKFTSQTSKS